MRIVILMGLLIASCATLTPAPSRPRVNEYLVDPEAGRLIGPREGSDLRIASCYRSMKGEDPPPGRFRCYAFPEPDYRSMMVYIQMLEAKTRACIEAP